MDYYLGGINSIEKTFLFRVELIKVSKKAALDSGYQMNQV